MKVLLAASECSPLARTNGLGDAIAGLAQGLTANGIEVGVVLPRYQSLRHVGEMHSGGGSLPAVYRHALGPVSFYLVEDPAAFDQPEWWRWGRFCIAVRALANDADVVHLHDAHVAPVALQCSRPTVLTVHNPRHEVRGPLDEAAHILEADPHDAAPLGALEWWGQANYLKAGLARASRVAVVSDGQLNALNDAGYDGVVAARSVSPEVIWNGIDLHAFDPSTDAALPGRFSAADLSGRAVARVRLLELGGIGDGTLLTYVGRMVPQHGVHLLRPILGDLVSEGLRLVLVGHGEPGVDQMITELVHEFPNRAVRFAYDREVAVLAMAGSDGFLAASQVWAPVGLLQALRYGCLPVAHRTIYRDLVPDVEEDLDIGIAFHFDPWTPEALSLAIRRMMRFRRDLPEAWTEAQRRAMGFDSSWETRSKEYIRLYEEAIAEG